MSSLYGVWQGSLCLTYIGYSRDDVIMGTHVGNFPHVVRAIWGGSDYTFADETYDLAYCDSYTASYIADFGVTYAATYYRETACNVRSLEWV